MLLEGYIQYALTSLTNLTYLEWTETRDTLSSILAILIFSAVVSFPPFLWWLLWTKRPGLNTDEMRQRIGSTYFEIKTHSKYALLYNVFYTSRRLLFALVITFLADAWVF